MPLALDWHSAPSQLWREDLPVPRRADTTVVVGNKGVEEGLDRLRYQGLISKALRKPLSVTRRRQAPADAPCQ